MVSLTTFYILGAIIKIVAIDHEYHFAFEASRENKLFLLFAISPKIKEYYASRCK